MNNEESYQNNNLTILEETENLIIVSPKNKSLEEMYEKAQKLANEKNKMVRFTFQGGVDFTFYPGKKIYTNSTETTLLETLSKDIKEREEKNKLRAKIIERYLKKQKAGENIGFKIKKYGEVFDCEILSFDSLLCLFKIRCFSDTLEQQDVEESVSPLDILIETEDDLF